MRAPSRPLLTLAAALLAGSLAACAHRPPATDQEALAEYRQTNDPLEPTNRFFYRVNNGLDAVVFKPLAEGYKYAVPAAVRTRVHNLLANLNDPVILANDMMEGKPRLAGTTLTRFVINSTLGIGGLFDVADKLGYPAHDNDFGITLALWGVPSGPYLFLPVLGPSSPREFTGFGADLGMDPFNWIGKGTTVTALQWSRYGVSAVDARERVLGDVEQIKKTALDPYATFRSLYRQHRENEIETIRNDHTATVPAWYPNAPQPATK